MSQHINNLLRHVPDLKERRVLDVGSGRGKFLIDCAKEGIEAKGLELNANYIRITRERAEKAGIAVDVAEGIAEALPFEDGSFDFINCAEVTEHVEDVRALVREFARVLTIGGKTYVSGHNRWGARDSHFHLWFVGWMPRFLAERYIALRSRHKGYGSMPDRHRLSEMNYFRFSEFVSLFKAFGFHVEDIREKRIRNEYPALVRPLVLLAYRVLRRIYFNTFHFLLTKEKDVVPPVRVAVLSSKPVMPTIGGKQAVTTHILNTVSDHYDTTLVTFDSGIDNTVLNDIYATQLSCKQYQCAFIYRWVPHVESGWLWILRHHLLMRWAKRNRHHFDVMVSATGELDMGKKGVQIIYNPTPNLFNPTAHSVLGRVNRALSFAASTLLIECMKKNVTLSISEWTREQARRAYGIDSHIVYPPVPMFSHVVKRERESWSGRDDGFVCIARLTPEKKIDEAIEIMRRVHERSQGVQLHIVGDEREPEYFAHIQDVVRRHSWITLHQRLSRAALEKLIVRNKYGIHPMHNEHFGIAVAELIEGGAIPFVHNSGGQVEIVDRNERLTYNSIDDAVEKIMTLMADKDAQQDIRKHLSGHVQKFLVPEFQKRVLNIIETFYERE